MEKIRQRDFLSGLWKGTLDLVYPSINSSGAATVLSNSLKGAIAIVQFLNEENKIVYGVLCDFSKEENGGYGPLDPIENDDLQK